MEQDGTSWSRRRWFRASLHCLWLVTARIPRRSLPFRLIGFGCFGMRWCHGSWWLWSQGITVTVLGAGLHESVREWSRKVPRGRRSLVGTLNILGAPLKEHRGGNNNNSNNNNSKRTVRMRGNIPRSNPTRDPEGREVGQVSL